jgi:hypothetical protein
MTQMNTRCVPDEAATTRILTEARSIFQLKTASTLHHQLVRAASGRLGNSGHPSKLVLAHFL